MDKKLSGYILISLAVIILIVFIPLMLFGLGFSNNPSLDILQQLPFLVIPLALGYIGFEKLSKSGETAQISGKTIWIILGIIALILVICSAWIISST